MTMAELNTLLMDARMKLVLAIDPKHGVLTDAQIQQINNAWTLLYDVTAELDPSWGKAAA